MAGLAATLGSGAMTNSIGEIEFNDVLFIIGSNAPEAHPIIGNKMKRATLHGAKLIVVDPRRTELAEYAHLWLRLKPGTYLGPLELSQDGVTLEGAAPGVIDATQSLHESVRQRWDADPAYRPAALREYFKRVGDPRA